MAWVNRDEQSLICEALDHYMLALKADAAAAAQAGNLPKITQLANDYGEAARLEQRLYSYKKDR
jgi:hypothetical protein